MKFYLFRCKARRQLLGATRYETGSNLPTERCIGGWEFVELLHLTGPKLPKYTVDVTRLRRGVQQNGLYVWEEKSLPGPVAAMVPPPPLAPVVELPTVSVDPVAPPAPVAPPPPVPVLTPLPEPVAPTPPLYTAPAPPPPAPEAPARIVPPPPVRSAPAPSLPAATPPPVRPAAPPPRPVAAPPPPKPVPVAAPAPARPAPAPQQPVPVAASVAPMQPAAASPAAHQPPARRPAHQVVWFDIPVLDLERAVRFYSAVLGAPLEPVQAGFGPPTIALLPHPDGAITGSLVQVADAKPAEGGPLIYLTAQGRLDEAVAAAQMNGGKVVQAKHSIGTAGSRAIVLDSEGNRIALHST